MSKRTFENLVTSILLAGALILTLGCETRGVTVTRPDGTVVAYNRASLFSSSNSDGLNFSRDGEDVFLEIGPTGSETEFEALIKAIQFGAKIAVPAP